LGHFPHAKIYVRGGPRARNCLPPIATTSLTKLVAMTNSPVSWRQLPLPVSGARNYDTLRRQMTAAKKTNMDSDFEEDAVVVTVIGKVR